MADTKTTALTENTDPLQTDIMYMVDDPGASPLSQKVTMATLLTALSGGMLPGGRLTLTTATPVTTADVTAAVTLYYTPYLHNMIRLYDGTSWRSVIFTEKSLSLAAYTASKPYDIWGYLSGGTLALESTVWTDTTTRATALAYQDGRLVKTGAATRLYLGTIFINASGGQTDDSLTKRNVFNYYNRRERAFYLTEATGHTYTTAAWQYWNNTNTNIIEYMCGVAEDAMQLSFFDTLIYVSSGTANVFLGMDLDAATAAEVTYPSIGLTTTNTSNKSASSSTIMPTLGKHFISVIEYGGANANQSRYRLSGTFMA